MKKKWIAAAAAGLVLILLWSVLFIVDYHAVMNLSNPVIAQHIGAEGGTFRGPGWVVQIEKYHDAELGWVTESAEIYHFGRLVAAAIS